MSESEEKRFRLRQHKRATVRLPVMLIDNGEAIEAQMRELSRGGALVECAREIPVDTPLHLGFNIKNVSEVIELPVSVIYLRKPESDARIEKGWGVGLKFEDVDEELGARIDTYVKDQRFFGPYSTLLQEFRRTREKGSAKQ